ncbi:MAG: FAD-dependent oxidoreductase [Clostridia bacterium]|nr:FAD-dependent oxidoreductase [Clostridia bacterium]
MKKTLTRIALALALVLALGMAAVAETAADGVYHGASFGRNGDIEVDVTLTDGALSDIAVTAHTETDNIGTVAVEELPGMIVEAQSLAIDGLSGATFTSNGIKRAVENALTEAGIDVEPLKEAPEKVTGQSYDVEADVVVVGGGGAGLAAAVSALQSGAESVVVVEKTDILGGDTNVNGGIYNTPDAEMQDAVEMTDGQKSLVEAAIAEAPVSDEHAALIEAVKADWDDYLASGNTGIFDSANWFALQTWNGGDKVAKLDLVENMANNAYAGYEWLKSLGQEFKPTISQGPGSLFPRTHDTPSGIGAEFINTYIDYLGANYVDQVEFYFGVTADALELTDGVCNTVKGTDADGNTYTFTAKGGVVLATGGFAGNVDMRVEYCQSEKWPDLGPNVGCTGVASDTGDGILMAKAIGANLIDMDQIQLLHTCSPKYGTTEDNSDKGKSVDSIIFVNKAGERFVAEDERRDTICLAVLEQEDALFYTVESYDGYGDKTLDELHSNNFVSYTDEIARDNMFIGDTIEDLAAAMGADPEKLRASIEGYNASVDAGATTDEFGRKTFINKLENGPFIAVPRKPSAHHTMGGVEINVNTEVLDTEGNAIPGLYAAGEVTGGIHGGNRLGGNAIVDTVVNGKTAGEKAAQLAK